MGEFGNQPPQEFQKEGFLQRLRKKLGPNALRGAAIAAGITAAEKAMPSDLDQSDKKIEIKQENTTAPEPPTSGIEIGPVTIRPLSERAEQKPADYDALAELEKMPREAKLGKPELPNLDK